MVTAHIMEVWEEYQSSALGLTNLRYFADINIKSKAQIVSVIDQGQNPIVAIKIEHYF